MDYYGLLWIVMDYYGLLWIINILYFYILRILTDTSYEKNSRKKNIFSLS
jgi:hypothetical protein